MRRYLVQPIAFGMSVWLGACLPAWGDEADRCRQDLLTTEGFDVLQVWSSGGHAKQKALLALAQSDYKSEGLNLARTLHWLSANAGLSRQIFRRVRSALENCPLCLPSYERCSREVQTRALKREIDNIRKEFSSAPAEFWDLIEEWFDASEYPHQGKGPSRNEVLNRIKLAALSADTREKEEFFNASLKAIKITLVNEKNRAPTSHEILLLDRKYRLVERMLQQLVFYFDRAFNIIPSASYPPNPRWYARLIENANRWIRDPSGEEGLYRTKEMIETEIKTVSPWLDRFGVNKPVGLELEAFPLAKRFALRTVAEALAGSARSYPAHADLQKEFSQFLRAAISGLAAQVDIENGEHLPDESIEPEMEAVFQNGLEIQSDGEIQANTLEITPSDTPKPKKSPKPKKQAPFGEALAQAEAAVKVPTTHWPRRKDRRLEQSSSAAAGELAWETNLPSLELTTAECLSLIDTHAASPWHAKVIRKQMEEVQRHHSEAVFDREIQSIADVLLKMSASSRLQEESYGRRLKKLTQKNLREIKPQGRSTVRVIFGIDSDGLKLLRILPRSKNNANDTARKLNDLEHEWASLYEK